MHRSIRGALALALLTPLLASCGGDDGDQPRPDAGAGDGGQLFRCDKVGAACNPHDPCAIDAVCGADGYCRPQRFQDCDDGLACTRDVCLGNGKCDHDVLTGCAVLVKGASKKQCVPEGAVNPEDPCTACEPAQDATKYSPRSGVSPCDDGNPCTVGDVCLQGSCEGRLYSCSDPYSCTQDTCDGIGGCTNELKAGFCLIGGACHPDDGLSDSGCERCDAQASPRAWTPVSDVCRIGALCFAAGAPDVTGCGVCDPQANASGWTAAANVCAIGGKCVSAGTADATGCGVCDPAQSASTYTPAAGKCLIADACVAEGAPSPTGCGRCAPSASRHFWSPLPTATATFAGFESGAEGYVAEPLASGVGWQVTALRARSGGASLGFTNATSGSLDDGAAHKGTVQSPPLALPAGQRAAALLWIYLDVEASPQHDLLVISAGGQVLWQKTAATVPAASYRSWFPVELDLSALAGQTVELVLAFDTVDAWANAGAGVFVDDVTLITGCGAL